MATTTLRPNGVVGTPDVFDIEPSGTVATVTSDDSDSTYVGMAADDDFVVSLGDITVPAGSVVKSARVRLKTRMYDLNPASICVAQLSIGDEQPIAQTTLTWLTPTEHTLFTHEFTFTDAEIDAATLEIRHGGGIGSFQVVEIYVDIVHVPVPVVIPALPTGTVTDDTSPTVAWGVTFDAAGGIPTHHETKIFDAATYGGGGFDPDTSTPTIESGIVEELPVLSFGWVGGWEPSENLADGTYRAYTRQAQTINGELHWSDWAFGGFVMDALRPLEPTMVLTPEPSQGRIKIELEREAPRTNLVTNPKAGTNTTDWTATGTTTFERVTSLPAGGVPAGVATALHAVGNSDNDRVDLTFATVVGVEYTASIYLRIASLSATSVRLRVFTGFENHDEDITAVGGSFVRYDVTFTATATTYTIRTRQVGAGAADWHWTAVLAEEGPATQSYFDGDTDNAAWNGTANGSTSTLGLSSDLFVVERSLDGGGTWVGLRTDGAAPGFVPRSGDEGLAYDYEAPNGVAAMYRGSTIHFFSAAEWTVSEWVTGSETWESRSIWLKHPFDPTLNYEAAFGELTSFPGWTRAARQAIHHPLGATDAVGIADTRGPEAGQLAVRLDDDAARAALDALLAEGVAMLLQFPVGDHEVDRWIAIGDQDRQRVRDKSWVAPVNDTLNWTKVARPEGSADPVLTGDPLLI